MKIFYTILLLIMSFGAFAQSEEKPSKLAAHLSIGQYAASLSPSFDAIHFGVNAGVTYHWNENQKHRFIQSGNLAYFYHKDLQTAVQLFTEVGYQIKLENGLQITPFSIGGGYVFSVSDLTTLDWNATTQQYEVNKFPVKHNWLISLGASLGYETKLKIAQRPLSFFLDYRLQIQGVIVRDAVPVLPYSPIRIGVAVPL
jgi:hypothetical protein